MEWNEAQNMAWRIWIKQETVSRLIRTMVDEEVKARSGVVLAAKLPGRQHDMLITVRRLCQECPEGTPLKDLARHMSITPPTASIMVESLVKQGFLERLSSREDRRVKLIRLTPKAESIYHTGDVAVVNKILELAASFDSSFFGQWHDIVDRLEKCMCARVGR